MSSDDDEIDYNGYKIDEQSQMILIVLRDQGDQTAGTLADRAGLEDTSSVHHRTENHIGATAAGLVERTDGDPRSGGQRDEVVYTLTEEGEQFVDAHQSELIDAVSAAEAVETLTRIRAQIKEFEERVSNAEKLVEANDRWQNRWSTRVSRVEDALGELEETVESKPSMTDYRFLDRKRKEAAGEHDSLAARFDGIEGALGGLSQQLSTLDGRLDGIESALDNRVTERELEDVVEPMEDRLSADIKSAERKAEEGLF